MKQLLVALCLLFVGLSTGAAGAADEGQDDTKIMDEAFSALQNGKFDVAVSKADLVIDRFEASRDINTGYVCTSGGTDMLASLLGVAGATADAKKTDEKGTTSAVSDNVCAAYFVKGFALVDQQQRAKALPNFEMAVALDPDNQHYLNELAEWHKAGGDWQKSLELFTAASEVTDLAIATMDDQREAKSILNTMRCRSYRGIAFSHVELQQWDAASAALKKCLAIIPGDPKSKAELEFIKTNAGK